MQLRELQDVIARTYLERDTERGVAVTIAWLAEEVGELATRGAQGLARGAGARDGRRAGVARVAREPARHRLRRGDRALRERVPEVRGDPVRVPVTSLPVT